MFTTLIPAFTAFVISIASLPSIIRIANRMELFDEPNERKLHTSRIPLLGGLAIFAAVVFSFTLWGAGYFRPESVLIIASLVILFFMGLRDDLLPLSPFIKIFCQTVAALLVVLFCNLRLSHPPGLFEIHTLPEIPAMTAGILILLFITNAYNLIDGVDGLAAGLGTIASFSFGLLFYFMEDPLMAVFAFAVCGALLGFSLFNVSPARIFMGDSGTMTVGFSLAIFAIRLSALPLPEPGGISGYSPVLATAILIIPVIDTLRVFTIRIFRRRSPFAPDKNHIHHRLLLLGLSHNAVTLLLCTVNLGFIFTAWLLRHQNPTLVFYFLVLTALVL
ncbi:MAG: undecaprenyl/decaprenyl-phosphate alpha-N-acetylglucosaminyl 1-phosphate transferase, partial [Bacteroidia bacterium]|nr:undecaprenyl/decaprenyl-phosphate alpha-N-acetylglucosaminyl 1-phosphate transferase [Bacteroidia bacterium]